MTDPRSTVPADNEPTDAVVERALKMQAGTVLAREVERLRALILSAPKVTARRLSDVDDWEALAAQVGGAVVVERDISDEYVSWLRIPSPDGSVFTLGEHDALLIVDHCAEPFPAVVPAVAVPAETRDAAGMLAQFHAAFGQPYGHGDIADSDLRIRLHNEENRELVDALRDGDFVAAAQELADVVYVAYGTAHSLGIPLDAVLAEVHRANMTKFVDGQAVLDEGGKVVKPPSFVPANVAGVLAEPAPCPCCLGDPDLVCDACGQHCCWAGEMFCEDYRTAGVVNRADYVEETS